MRRVFLRVSETLIDASFAQALQVPPPVPVIEEARHPVVAALHDMLRHTGKIGTREPGHEAIVPFPPGRYLRHHPR